MKMMIRLMVLALMVNLAFVDLALAKGPKVAFVDLRKVFREYNGTESAIDSLKGEIQKKQAEINSKKEEITKLRQDYEKKSVILSDAEKEKKSEEIDAKIKELQGFVSEANRELRGKEEEMTREVIKKIKAVIDEISQKQRFDFVLDNNERVVLYANEKMDITDQVISKLQKK